MEFFQAWIFYGFKIYYKYISTYLFILNILINMEYAKYIFYYNF